MPEMPTMKVAATGLLAAPSALVPSVVSPWTTVLVCSRVRSRITSAPTTRMSACAVTGECATSDAARTMSALPSANSRESHANRHRGKAAKAQRQDSSCRARTEHKHWAGARVAEVDVVVEGRVAGHDQLACLRGQENGVRSAL